MSIFLQKILVICGPTASGKSELAIRLAQKLDAEIINADSMQVYRGMDIGTAKPTPEQRSETPHHLIDIIDPDENFSAADFMAAADAAVIDIRERGKQVIVVGGTGLYIRALLKGLVDLPGGMQKIRAGLQEEAARLGNEAMLERLRLVDPDLAATLHPNNLQRIIRALEVEQMTGMPLSRYQQQHAFASRRYESMQIGTLLPRSGLYGRIEERVERMMAEGLADEVRGLLAAGFGRDLKPMRSIGYKETVAYLNGEMTMEEAVSLIKRNTRRYAKRQMTWFNADSDILWFEYPEKFDTLLQHAIDFFEREA